MNTIDQNELAYYKTESTSKVTLQVDDILLSETSINRRSVRASIIKNNKNPKASLSLKLIYANNGKEGFKDTAPPDLRKLRVGEVLSCSLNEEETRALFEKMLALYSLSKNCSYGYGIHRYAVIKLKGSDVEANELSSLVSKCQNSPGLAKQLAELSPELVEAAYHHRLLKKKQEGLTRFQVMLKEECNELAWQELFEEHDWIIGGTCDIQFITKIAGQPIVASANVHGTCQRKGDILFASQGNVRFTTLVELKKVNTPLLKEEKSRPGQYYPSSDLSAGLAQLRLYMRKWHVEGSRLEANKDILENEGIYTIQPRGILIIGHLEELGKNRNKIESFELFRQNQKDVHIVTFDEVYWRAQSLFMVHND